jgi:hypothetical protein
MMKILLTVGPPLYMYDGYVLTERKVMTKENTRMRMMRMLIRLCCRFRPYIPHVREGQERWHVKQMDFEMCPNTSTGISSNVI